MRDDGITVTLRIEVQCSRAGLRTSSNLDLSRFVPLRMKRRGVETRIIIAAGDDLPQKVDPALLKAVARSRAWFEELASGSVLVGGDRATRGHRCALRRASFSSGIHSTRYRRSNLPGASAG